MLMNGDSEQNPAVSLYFHIPFCRKKCAYCHFYVIPDNEAHKDLLFQSFLNELALQQPLLQGKKIATIYFGGGTPSLFGPDRIEKLLNEISRNYSFETSSPEITLEANPEDITVDLMRNYHTSGINRASIGVQTLNNELLNILGRTHNGNRAVEAVHATHKAGISNISIDLMYDLPHQTLAVWESTLKIATQLPITHLSLYNLTIEPHTLFFKRQKELQKVIPDEELSLKMYEKAIELLEEGGLKQYEISAFARDGIYSRHNTGYWTGRQFLGFGPSAFSYWDGHRFQNVANLSRYAKALESGQSPVDFNEKLDIDAQRRELFVIRMRMLEGIDLMVFEAKYGILDTQSKQTLKELERMNWIESKNNRFKLTKKGILFYDSLASDLI